MANNLKVILFEDAARTRADLLGALEKHLKPDGEVIPFEAKHL